MLAKGAKPEPLAVEDTIKSPYVLEFLDLKDEYSESDLEEALIQKLEAFLLELGGDAESEAKERPALPNG